MADAEEVTNFFSEAAKEGQEELENELEEMLALDQLGQLDPAKTDYIEDKNKDKVHEQIKPKPMKEATEEEADELEAMMAI